MMFIFWSYSLVRGWNYFLWSLILPLFTCLFHFWTLCLFREKNRLITKFYMYPISWHGDQLLSNWLPWLPWWAASYNYRLYFDQEDLFKDYLLPEDCTVFGSVHWLLVLYYIISTLIMPFRIWCIVPVKGISGWDFLAVISKRC